MTFWGWMYQKWSVILLANHCWTDNCQMLSDVEELMNSQGVMKNCQGIEE
uniref:SRCR domain-containing protein n=1 Tax=Arion vulgaris TaxID=1028688 RepID=A0A0B6YMI3_9EUPU